MEGGRWGGRWEVGGRGGMQRRVWKEGGARKKEVVAGDRVGGSKGCIGERGVGW